MSRRVEILILIVILGVAVWLRLRGIGWGLPYPYHPDEGSILFHSLGFGTGDLNPHWFRWPSLVMYEMFAVYGAYFVVGKFTGLFAAPLDLVRQYLTDLTPFWMLGRLASAAAGVVTVWVTYLIGRRAFGRFAGIVGAALMSVVFLHVRDSHYATPDVATTLLASLSLLLAVAATGTGRVRTLVLSGLFAGLAASAKYPGVLAGVGTVAAFVVMFRRGRVGAGAIVALLVAGAVGFVAGTPFSVLSPAEFWRDIGTQFTMVSTSGPIVGQSFGGGLGEIFARTLARGVGYPVLALALIGCLVPARRWEGLSPAGHVEAGRGEVGHGEASHGETGRGEAGHGDARRGKARRGGEAGGGHVGPSASAGKAVLISYAVAVLLVMSLLTVKRSTYLTPALPAVVALAGAGLAGLFTYWSRPGRLATASLAALLVVVLTGIPSVRFVSALGAVDTRTRAKAWVEETVEPGTRIALETYGPVLNRTGEQLAAMARGSETAVESWRGPKRQLAELRREVEEDRSPQYELYSIDWGHALYRLPDPWDEPEELLESMTELGVRYVILTSKAQQYRAMKGAEPPPLNMPWPFYDAVVARSTLVARFDDESGMPGIDRGVGRSFHNPVIEIYALDGAAGEPGRTENGSSDQ